MADGRRLRGIRPRQAVRAFEKAGYRVERVHRSHYILEHAERPPVQLPYHGDLKIGLLLTMVKRAGMTVEEFENLL